MDMFYYDCTVTLIDATKCPTTLVGFSDEEANKDGSISMLMDVLV